MEELAVEVNQAMVVVVIPAEEILEAVEVAREAAFPVAEVREVAHILAVAIQELVILVEGTPVVGTLVPQHFRSTALGPPGESIMVPLEIQIFQGGRLL